VYSKKKVVILDDVFSGMDASTEHLVFNRLLGSEGILRKNGATVVIATHAGQCPLLRVPQHINS
jgi:ATP-binding cassette, subfamily C (CFTR/MRP), member 1